MLRPPALAIVCLLVPTVLAAPETDTDQTAARDALRKRNELEASRDIPGMVARLTGQNAERDAGVARAKELMDRELLAMADDIATHPEIGFEEKRSIGKL